MPKEDPTSPIVPSGPRLQSNDVELAHFAKPPPHRNQRRSSCKCFVYALALIVILRAAFLGFALTVCVKSPELRLRCIDVKSLDYSTATSFLAPSITSPVGEAILRNTNFGGFEFSNSTAVSVIHGGAALGGGRSKEGEAKERSERRDECREIKPPLGERNGKL
ncbi:hypothetical protein ACJRO7_012283 [Eucalyptus globulus]|uniref:Uncharacterized protein n=1 Tax=Eucalyptus globulus TaxID=34317 RepID=A0ABD3LI06_EUCGL